MSDQLPANPLAKHIDDAQKHRRPQSQRGGGSILKFNGKTGEWPLGLEETDVEGCHMLVNAQKIQHGYVRWGEIPPAKSFTPDWAPYPPKIEPLEGIDNETKRPKTYTSEEARQFEGAFVGEDEELGPFLFNTSSMAGVENTDKLYDQIYLQARENPEYIYPLVKLSSEFYKRSTGKVYKPVFEIVAWCDVNGNRLSEAKKVEDKSTDDTPDDDDTPRRRRRRAA